MIYPKIEDCIANAAGSKYVLVSMVAKRAKDLALRNPMNPTAVGKEKQISSAMREVIEGKMKPVFGAAQNQAK